MHVSTEPEKISTHCPCPPFPSIPLPVEASCGIMQDSNGIPMAPASRSNRTQPDTTAIASSPPRNGIAYLDRVYQSVPGGRAQSRIPRALALSPRAVSPPALSLHRRSPVVNPHIRELTTEVEPNISPSIKRMSSEEGRMTN